MIHEILSVCSPLDLAGIGFCAGVVAALLGIGGGLLITPFLNLLGIPLPIAVPTSLTTIAATALCTTLRNRRWKNLDLRLGLITSALMLPTVELSTRLTRHLAGLDHDRVDTWLRGGFIVVLLVSMYSVLRPPKPGTRVRGPGPYITGSDGAQRSLPVLVIGAYLAGIIGGLLGIGGGRVLVPLFVGLLAVDLRIALGTSSLVIFLTSCYAAASFLGKGMVDLGAVAFLCCGSLLGSLVGSAALRQCGIGFIRVMYTVISLAALAALALKQAGADRSAFAVLLTTCIAVTLSAFAVVVRRRPDPQPEPVP